MREYELNDMRFALVTSSNIVVKGFLRERNRA